MRSLLLIARSNLLRRKAQSALVGAILALSAVLLYAGIGVYREIDAPVRAMLNAQRASQLTLFFDAHAHDPEAVRAWWLTHPQVEAVSEPLATIEIRESAFFQGRQLSRLLLATERPVSATDQDLIRIVRGTAAQGPGPGEVWIPTGLADEMGMQAGDTLQFPGAGGMTPLVISAIVVDPLASGAFANPVRVWVGAGELPTLVASTVLNRVMLSVRFDAAADVDAAWDRYLRTLGGVYNGGLMSERDVMASYTAPYAIGAGVIMAFSALGFLVALMAMHGTITSAVLADFPVIGILRAQGFRPVDVALCYMLQYLTLAAVAIPVGVLAGMLVVRQAVALLTRTVATPVPLLPLAILGIGVALVMLAIVTLLVARTTRVAARVRPIDAIRYGGTASSGPGQAGLSLRTLRWASVPMIVAIRNLLQQKRRAAVLGLAVVAATLAATMAINLDYTFRRMSTQLADFGFDAADVRITRAGRRFGLRHDDLMHILADRPGVRAVATWDGMDGAFPVDSLGTTRLVYGMVVDGDMAGLGFRNLRGRNPTGPGEVSIGVRTAEELGLDVGRTVTVQILGAPLTLTVVGVYQSINNTGHGFRVRIEAAHQANPLWSPSEYSVALTPGTNRDGFMSALEAEYGEAVDAKPGDYFIRDQLVQIIMGLRLTNGFLSLVFLLAAAVFITNTTLLTIAENRQVFGILKTTGMTPAQLRASVVTGVGVQAVSGVVLALVLWFLAARGVLSIVFGTVGLVAFPLQHWVLGMAIMAPLIVGFCLASAWWPSRHVLAVTTRTLIVE